MDSNGSLNHIYRSVWNEALGAMVAVAELAPARGKGARSLALPSLPSLTVSALAVAIAWGAAMRPALANPAGGVAIHGQATVTSNGNQMLVTTQNGAGTNHSAINWQSFSIPTGSGTYFQQPNANSTSINRVVSNTPSQIFGTLGSNGKLVLVNQSGITVGAGAVVDTAGFTASALRMTDADAIAGRLRFGDATVPGGDVNVQGSILARSGDVVLMGSKVLAGQSAIVQAPNGNTILAAGQQIEITGRGLEGISMQVQAPTDSAVNLGTLKGDAVGIFAGTLKHSGNIQATAVSTEGGKVFLKAADSVTVDGTVSAKALNGLGGSVQATANKVMLKSGAMVDVSGTNGGGEALIGGGLHGTAARVANANTTTVEQGVAINADATVLGNGGTIVVWSDDTTTVQADLSAKGGAQGGKGGFIETSGKKSLYASGTRVNTLAADGSAGTWLLDPTSVTISHDTSAGPGTAGSTVSDFDINEVLKTTDVLITTTSGGTGDITFDTGTVAGNAISISSTNGLRTLQLNAFGGIQTIGTNGVNFSATGAGSLSIDFQAANGGIEIGSPLTASNINTKGGSVNFSAAGSISNYAPIVTSGGNVGLAAGGSLRTAAINTSGLNGSGGNAGSISLSTYDQITLSGDLVAVGGSGGSGNTGGNGGAVTISYTGPGYFDLGLANIAVDVSGGRGGDGTFTGQKGDDGGFAGTVSIYSPTSLRLGAIAITAKGGDGGDAYSGYGGSVASGGAGQNGGSVYLNAFCSSLCDANPGIQFSGTFSVNTHGGQFGADDKGALGGIGNTGAIYLSTGGHDISQDSGSAITGKADMVFTNTGTVDLYTNGAGNAIGYVSGGNSETFLNGSFRVKGTEGVGSGGIYSTGDIWLKSDAGGFLDLRGDVSSQGGDVRLVADTNVGSNASPSVFSGGGSIFIAGYGGTVDIYGINSASNGGNAGNVQIVAGSDVTLRYVNARGSDNPSGGGNGGNVVINAGGTVNIPGVYIDAYGGNGYNGGGQGGSVSILAGGNILADAGGISTYGGAATNLVSPGGSAGDVTLRAHGDVVLGSIDAYGDYTNGGNGGNVLVFAGNAGGTGSISSTYYIDASGGDNSGVSSAGKGGRGGNVTLTANGGLVSMSSFIDAYGGSSLAGGDGGNAGNVTINATGTNRANASSIGRIDSLAGTGNNTGYGGTITIDVAHDLNLNDFVYGGAAVRIRAAGNLSLYGNVSSDASGDAIILAAGGTFSDNGNFLQPSALNARWLVYAADPNGHAYGIADFLQFGAGIGATPAQLTGNGFLYSTTPTVSTSISINGTPTKQYDGNNSINVDFGPDFYAVDAPYIDSIRLAQGIGTLNDKNVGNSIAITATNPTVLAAKLGATNVYGLQVDAVATGYGSIVKAPITAIVANRAYDGTTSVNAADPNVNFAIAGLVAGESLSVSGNRTIADKNIGTNRGFTDATPFNLVDNLAAGGGLASNYDFSGVTQYVNITQRASSTWSGAASDQLWSTKGNWVDGAIPDGNNVLNVVIPQSAKVTFDASVGKTVLQSINSQGTLNMAGGALDVASSLTTRAYTQTDGAVTGAGSFTVTDSFNQTGGTVAVGGPVAIRQSAGDMVVSSVSGTSVALKATAGSITQTTSTTQTGGIKTAGLLSADAASGVTLNDSNNAVSQFSATISGAGNLSFVNKKVMSVVGITVANGNMALDNTGALTVDKTTDTSTIKVNGGSLKLEAHSPININGNLLASGDITLAALTANADSNITVNGNLTSTAGGITAQAHNNYIQNSKLFAALGINISAGGTIALGKDAFSTGNPLNYTANGVAYTPPWVAAAQTGGPTSFVADFLNQFQTALDAQVFTADDPLGKKQAKNEGVVVEGNICTP